MASIPQTRLFRWSDVDVLDDLHRLRRVLESVPDEALMRRLERARGKGRDDYPVRAVWNSLLAGVVFAHASIASLRRELLRNAALREACGFDVVKGARAVPPAWVYTRFLRRLVEEADAVSALFDRLVEQAAGMLEGFGRVLALDGKAIRTHARPRRKGTPTPSPDGRRDVDADFGAKRRRERKDDGAWVTRVTYWYGYKLHLVVDAVYELPVAYRVTAASRGEAPEGRGLIADLAERHPALLKRARVLTADKGYDDTQLLTTLWDAHEIAPVIPVRDDWPDDEPTRALGGHRHVTYSQRGEVACWPRQGPARPMAFGGFEAARGTLKYRCPARRYGLACDRRETCPAQVRIGLDEDRRVFVPVARSSYKWARLYRRRNAVERINSRLDVSYGFERHFVRGLAKMRLRLDLALITMLAMAVGHAREAEGEEVAGLRSLVSAA